MANSASLVPVFAGNIQNTPVQLCDARTLHDFMDVRRDFTTWIKGRIRKFGFVQDMDYLLTKSGEQLPSGTKYRDNYHLTLDMAKELAMVENNPKGREVRRYFIECERRVLGRQYPYSVTPNQTLSAEQADELRGLITTHAESLPKEKRAAFIIQAWSKLRAHFGVGYRQIPASRFTEALSILARHIAGQNTPSLLNRRWLVSIDHLGCEQVTPIPGDAGILRLADLPQTLRDPGALIDAELLAEIGAACFERLRSKVGALKEARFIQSERTRRLSS